MAKPEPVEVQKVTPAVEEEEEEEEEEGAEGGAVGVDESQGVMEVSATGTEVGACVGSDSPEQLSESIMDDINDNLSMEVQLGDDSSRHPSEISSISYQTLLEEGDSRHYSRRDSEDSNDSYPPDDPDADFPPDDIEQFEAADLPLSRIMKETGKLDKSATLKRGRCEDDGFQDTGTKGVSEEPKVKVAVSGSHEKGNAACDDGLNCHDQNGTQSGMCDSERVPESYGPETVVLRSHPTSMETGDLPAGSKSKGGSGEEGVKKRNSLEIRNNIPTVDEVKDVGGSNMEDRSLSSQGAKPKIRKQSPGVARRVDEEQDPDRSSSEREHTPTDRQTEPSSGKSHEQHAVDRSDTASDPGRASHLQKNMDIENEYNYVKYARVHQGNSYVGMRLAYSSSNDSLSLKRNSTYSQGSDSIQSSRESSPEKTFQHKLDACSLRNSERVSEDLLTEIPLNGSEGQGDADKHSFTLSPDNTECDSQEVESLLSDGDQSNLGMPAVEDGLSSSQASDADDNVPPSASHPVHMLRQKQKDHVDKELTQSQEHYPEKGKEIDAQAIMNDLKAKREALDLAIADIKSAIQRSKGVALQSSYTEEVEEEPVWVMRDNHAQKMQQRQEEMRRVCEEIERLQDDQFAAEQKEQEKTVDIAPAKPEEAETTAAGHDTLEDSLAQYDSDRDSQLGVEDRGASGIADDSGLREQHGESEFTSSNSGYYNEDVWYHRSGNQVEGTQDDDGEEEEEEGEEEEGEEDARRRDQPDEEAEDRDGAGAEAGYDSAEEELDESSPTLGCEARLLRRGYESDDEYEDKEGIRYTRRSKGKKYAPLKKDDSIENGVFRNSNSVRGDMDRNHSIQSLSNTTKCEPKSFHLKPEYRDNSEANYSSEELGSDAEPASKNTYLRDGHGDSDTDEETDRLLQKQYQKRDQRVEIPELSQPPVNRSAQAEKRRSRAKEGEQESLSIRNPDNPEVLIEGVLFRARYLGSTQLVSEGQPSKAMRMMQAQEAVGRIKAPEGENQPSTEVDLFVSTEKIMVLNTDLQEIMMDHALRTISYIADIGDILVIMARRRLITSPDDLPGRRRRQAKILCHVFESDEAQLIAQSIGQAFQVAYLEFLKANGVEDPGLLKEMDYQDVLNQQEIYGEELQLFTNKEFHKEVIVPKAKNEPLGVVIVESGWGSMVPTVVLANMAPSGPAARCGQLNIGDQIISINGISLVGLPLSTCQTYIKNAKSQTVVKLTVVPCPPVVEVLIKRPDVKYQLGFSVQNGVICSLLRGGIAERGGVRVGHRIIEINNQSVVAVPHEKIVSLLANSVGEIHMKTMPTSIFRLLTGQDVPHYL